MTKSVVDCHVNIWEDKHVLPLYHQQLQRVRPGAMQDKADAEIAAAVLYLESAYFVSGEILHVDGGAHAGKWSRCPAC